MKSQAHSVVEPSRTSKGAAAVIVIFYALLSMVPLSWITLTAFKSPPDSIAYPPKVVFDPSLEEFCNLFNSQSRQTDEYIDSMLRSGGLCDEVARKRNMVITGPSNFAPRFLN